MSNVGSGKSRPSLLIHCAKSKRPSSKVISSDAIVVKVVDSIVTTPCEPSSPIVHAEKTVINRSNFTFLLLLLVEFLMLL